MGDDARGRMGEGRRGRANGRENEKRRRRGYMLGKVQSEEEIGQLLELGNVIETE